MIRKKSQAALEFIMTYGWAILVVLVAIGALAYFGVLSPDRFLPNKCTMQSGIACLDHKATATTIAVNFRNSIGYDLTIIDVKAQQCTCKNPLGSGGCSAFIGTEPATLINGGTGAYTLTCVIPGSRYSGQFNISYSSSAEVGGLTHTNVGQITTRVE